MGGRFARAAAAAAVAATWGPRGAHATAPSCGVVAAAGPSGFLTVETTTPVCGQLLATDCRQSLQEAAAACPEACPLAVPDPVFSCFFTCIESQPGACAKVNPYTVYRNNETHLCEPCQVQGCKHCSSKTQCQVCHDGFILRPGGHECQFHLALHLPEIGLGLVVALVLLCIVALVYSWRTGPPEAAAQNLRAIIQARRHRHECKVQDWNTKGDVRSRYRIYSMNVHRKMILGVGLCLFYNSFVFQMLVHTICLAATWWIYTSSDISGTLLTTYEGAAGGQRADYSSCGAASQYSRIKEQMDNFAESNFKMLGALYGVLFLLSLAYGWFQKRHAAWFDSQNSTTEDYVLQLSGFPVDMPPDEAKLRAKLEERFKKIDPQVELVGVSISYNYGDLRGGDQGVDAVLFRFMERLDVVAGLYHEAYQSGGEPGATTVLTDEDTVSRALLLSAGRGPRKTMHEEEVEDRQIVEGWFANRDPEPKMTITGTVFCVFRHKGQKDTILAAAMHNHKELLEWEGLQAGLKLHAWHPYMEPTTIFWWHMGVSGGKFYLNLFGALCRILLTIALVAVCVFGPLTQFIVIPMSGTGTMPTGDLMMIVGILIGNINMLLCINIWLSAFNIGFHHKDRMDKLIFVANTLLTLLNTVFNIHMCTACTMQSADVTLSGLMRLDSLEAIGAQNRFAQHVYQIQVPGGLFVGYLMMPVMAGVVPYLWNSFLMYFIYVWGALPDVLLGLAKRFLPWAPESVKVYPMRNAEKGLEPMEVGLPWDYTNNIIIPSIAFSLLFFASPGVWKMFAGTLGWSVFVYCYYRVVHLRFNKLQMYTSPNLDATVTLLWGFPLSIIAAAAAHWGVHAGRLRSEWLVPAAFCTSLALWSVCFLLLLRPCSLHDRRFKEEDVDRPYEDMEADTVYSYFNVNPIYVLKCHFCPDLVKGHKQPLGFDGKTICYYEAGKEYWFFDEEQRRMAKSVKMQNDAWEIETYLDPLMHCLERCVCPKRQAEAVAAPVLPAEVGRQEPDETSRPRRGFLECCTSTKQRGYTAIAMES